MTIVLIASVRSSVQTIEATQYKGLSTVLETKYDHINAYFEQSITSLGLLAESENTLQFILALKSAYKKSQRSLEKFTGGYQWSVLEDEYGSDLSLFLTAHSHIDVMLLDDQANVLYSIRKDSDLGTNIFSSSSENGRLSSAIKRTLKTGSTSYSDLDFYQPYGNKLASFLAQAIVDEYGDKIGVLVVHISPEPIDKIMTISSNFGESVESYLVGQDLLMRTQSKFSEDSTVLKTVVDTTVTQNWLASFAEKEGQEQGSVNQSNRDQSNIDQTYKGRLGVSVIGSSLPVEFGGVRMLMIAEISEEEAHQPVTTLIQAVGIIALVIMVMVFMLSIYSVRTITRPIIHLTEWARTLSLGSLELREIQAPNNEIGELNQTFVKMVNSLDAVSEGMAAFAVGDLRASIIPRSDGDVLVMTLNQLREAMNVVVSQADAVAQGDYDTNVRPRSKQDLLGMSLQKMLVNLRLSQEQNDKQNWLKTSQAELAEVMRGDRDIETLSSDILNYIAIRFGAQIGSVYVVDPSRKSEALTFMSGYAQNLDSLPKQTLEFGEGLVGQTALEGGIKVLSDLPSQYLKVNSSTGDMAATEVVLLTISNNDKVSGVIELGSLKPFSVKQLELLELSSGSIALSLETCMSNNVTKALLAKTQKQSKQLLQANENLEEHAQQLKHSEQVLKQQGEELRVSNEELEEKQSMLQKQKRDVELGKEEIELKAQELEQASKYKSEFLANMSHELRTPLNSLLILSKSLAKNKTGNLTLAQQEDAQVIHDGGQDLLELINDIMDLSKVEAGMLVLTMERVELTVVANNTLTLFGRTAEEKGLDFSVSVAPELDKTIYSDGQRLQQIIKNLTSNALKFTRKGFVSINIHGIDPDIPFHLNKLTSENGLAISVSDSGEGISVEKQQAIFDAFQQEDGSTSREFGGTGLGLAISKELARLLCGEIHLQSVKGEGSTFTLFIPKHWDESMRAHEIGSTNATIEHLPVQDSRPKIAQSHSQVSEKPIVDVTASKSPRQEQEVPDLVSEWIADDRRNIQSGDKVLLVIEDDPHFAKILLRIGRENNQKVILSNRGRDGMMLALEYEPIGVLLDMGLPDINGLDVLEQLKFNLHTRGIPVHAISADDFSKASLSRGALSFVPKPASEETIIRALDEIAAVSKEQLKSILVVEDDLNGQKAISRLLENLNAKLEFTGTLHDTRVLLEKSEFDCIILDMGLPDAEGIDVLETVAALVTSQNTPIIVYTGQDITDETHKRLSELSASAIVKGSESPERLLDDVSLFIHHVGKQLSLEQQQKIKMLHNEDAMLLGRKVLLVDDDMRNVFALKRILDDVGFKVTPAENGQVAIDAVIAAQDEPFELILMDIMMPIKDGYQAMKEIRQQPGYRDTPIMALTAKAMPEDRQKCIDAGASDYVTKPIDTEKLLSMLRVWLYKNTG